LRSSDPDTSARGAARILLGLAALASIGGWSIFYFLTDDAHIAFRYVSNGLAGRGLVWNPPPFRPVEGYTSFLWVIALRAVWGLAGVEPPVASNRLSLAFGWGALFVGYRLVMRLRLPDALARDRVALLGALLFGVISNRTYLAWLSSGLETAMFDFLLLWFVLEALAPRAGRASPWWPVRLSLAAGLSALARPDGMLAVGCAAAILLLEAPRGRVGARLLGALPLALLPAHLAWRRVTYGDWLPNTYTAKYLGPWPESGARYLASFVLEYGIWVWLAIAGVWLGVRLRALRGRLLASLWAARNAALVVGMLAAHGGYYTFVIGGDHFEYRVYSHLIVLFWSSAIAMLIGVSRSRAAVAGALAAFAVASLPIPWVHWAVTHRLETRAETYAMAVPIAGHFPPPLDRLVAIWDGWQRWLIDHAVCRRHQEHRVFHAHRASIFPPREEGARIPWAERAVIAEGSVGVLGWVLPNVAILDELGLNDRVVARLPPPPRPGGRQMAHERRAPSAYVACFRPNLRIVLRERRAIVRPRELTDAQIRACESRDWREAAQAELGSAPGGVSQSRSSRPAMR
jgi:arabinofuranosyltransferase